MSSAPLKDGHLNSIYKKRRNEWNLGLLVNPLGVYGQPCQVKKEANPALKKGRHRSSFKLMNPKARLQNFDHLLSKVK